MAFNFNWSPLTADASFYTRARELLTTSLNKSPKPPIIVDDILVNELNLGSVPPDLEILEIGDLAEDRFRGIFKMCYSGDAFLTLKTRVQANPLNTYLSSKPSFTSPQPLAAASGLTIPIQITLSEIKLSAFIILVFSRQKGVTLVFRNDPLESLKVSSTFDAIPFVRDYLQKEIESQLRTLLMDELPLIIHRLSLRLFVPEYRERENDQLAKETGNLQTEEKAVDPLASPPQDPVDMTGNMIDPSQIASLSLDAGSETHALFSQKNLLRLGALTDCHKTLSLFTPGIRDVVFRAWAGPTERGDVNFASGKATPASAPSLTRANTFAGTNIGTYNFSDSTERISSSMKSVPAMLSSSASGSNLSLSKQSRSHGRKKKHRVVNLRKKTAHVGDDLESVSGDSTTNSATLSSAPSESNPSGGRPRTPELRDGELVTPPVSPENLMKEPGNAGTGMMVPPYRELTPRQSTNLRVETDDDTPRQSQYLGQASSKRTSLKTSQSLQHLRGRDFHQLPAHSLPPSPLSSNEPAAEVSGSQNQLPQLSPSPFDDASKDPLYSMQEGKPISPSRDHGPNVWMTNMISVIAQKVQDQKAADNDFWHRQGTQKQAQHGPSSSGEIYNDAGLSLDSPPPAYAL